MIETIRKCRRPLRIREAHFAYMAQLMLHRQSSREAPQPSDSAIDDEPMQLAGDDECSSLTSGSVSGNGTAQTIGNDAVAGPSTDTDPSATLLARAGVIEEEDLDPSMIQWLSGQGLMPEDFDANYGLFAPEDAVIIRPYGGEDDDILLQELRPRFVVMYEPNLAFIRRLEVSFTV